MASPFLITRRAVLTGHRDCVYALAHGPGEIVYSAGGDGLVVAWNLAGDEEPTGELIAQVPGSVYALRYRSATHHLLVGHNHQGVQVLDLTDKHVVRALPLPPTAIFDLALSETLGRAWAALGDGTLAEIDFADYSLRRLVRVSAAGLRTLAVAESRRELVVAGSDHVVRVLDAETLRLKHELVAHTNSVFSAALDPSESQLVTAGRDAQIRVWDAAHAYAPAHSIVGHLYAINHAVFSPDGAVLATASMDKSIKLWSGRTWRLLHVLNRARAAGHGTSVNRLIWTPTRHELVSCSDDRTVAVWRITLRPPAPAAPAE